MGKGAEWKERDQVKFRFSLPTSCIRWQSTLFSGGSSMSKSRIALPLYIGIRCTLVWCLDWTSGPHKTPKVYTRKRCVLFVHRTQLQLIMFQHISSLCSQLSLPPEDPRSLAALQLLHLIGLPPSVSIATLTTLSTDVVSLVFNAFLLQGKNYVVPSSIF